MQTKVVLSAALLVFCLSLTEARKCNAHNFLLKGVLPCAKCWLSSTHASKNVTFSPNMTTIIMQHFRKFNMSLESKNMSWGNFSFGQNMSVEREEMNLTRFYGNMSANPYNMSKYDHLSQLIETVALMEPYLAYALADVIKGFSLSSSDVDNLGLLRILSNATVLQRLYSDYFEQSCRSNIIGQLGKCVKGWLDENCDDEKDDVAVIKHMCHHASSYYCSNDSKVNATIKSWLDDSFGTVLAPVMRYFGIFKNNNSSMVFNMTRPSFISNASLERLAMSCHSNCGYLMEVFHSGPSFLSPDSNVSVGRAAEVVLSIKEKLINCMMRNLNQFQPSFLGNHTKFVNHLGFVLKRYGVMELSWQPGSFTKDRQTAGIFGGNHRLVIGEPKPETCASKDWGLLMSNRFFGLFAFSKPLGNGSYISQVQINFTDGVSYRSGEGKIGSRLINVTGNTKVLENLPDGSVRITDRKSGAVFVVALVKSAYLLFVRAGEEVYEPSIGGLAEGCLIPFSPVGQIWAAPAQKRTQCQRACAVAPKEFTTLCVYDCIGANDPQVTQYYNRIAELKKAAVARDGFIQNIFS